MRYVESKSKENCVCVCYLKKSLKGNGLEILGDVVLKKRLDKFFFFETAIKYKISLIIIARMEEEFH